MSRTKLIALVLCAGLAACAKRTAPATQGTAKSFNAGASDPKAVAIVDQMVAALGGEANWNKAHEIIWKQSIIIDGKLAVLSKHAWDRWNGRHQFSNWFTSGGFSVAMYELYGDTAFAFVDPPKGPPVPQMKADKEHLVTEARKRFDIDAYQFVLPFKLKDPGVKLAFSEERQAEGAAQGSPMKYDVIKVTFEPGVGPSPSETWYVVIDKATHLPDMYEHVAAGKADNERGGYKIEDWVEAGGLKFATRRTTLGYTKLDGPKVKLDIPATWVEDAGFAAMDVPSPGEIILIKDVTVEPEANEDLYVPNVTTM